MSLYLLGPFYPATAESVSESPYTNNTWVTPGQVSGEGSGCAYINAASYDANDKSWVLKAYDFPFSAIPDDATIVGVQSNINAQWTAGNTAPHLSLGQLLGADRTKQGTNQYAVSEAMSAEFTTHSTGGSTDLWGLSLSAAWLKHSGFGVAYAVSAKANNTDISANYIHMRVWYTTTDVVAESVGGSIRLHVLPE